MSKQESTAHKASDNGIVVDGHHVSTKKPKGIKKLVKMRFGKPVMFVLAFAVVGVIGVLFASAATTTSSLWSSSDVPKLITNNDTKSVELGVKFQAKYSGQVTAVKFYKGPQNTGLHTGTLWDNQGNKLATVTFTNETATGWQTATFPQAINIAANVTYVISYHAPNGHYSGDNNYFSQARVNGSLTALKSESNNPNGVYVYGDSVTFPTETYQASNYWVDVEFKTDIINPPSASAPPTQVTAAVEGNAVRVNWNKGTSSTTITKYRIYKNGVYLRAVGPSPLSYLDKDVKPGNTYRYQIKTVDIYGVGSIRSVAATVTFNVTPPTCPTGQTGTPPNCVPTPVSSAVPCALTTAAEACWAANTGPVNPAGGRYSKAQIVAGQSNLKKVTSQATAPAGTTYDNGKLTVTTEGAVVDRIWLEGCIAVKAKNVTISNSLINNVNHLTCSGGNAQALASTINNGGCVGENGDGPGAMTGMVITDTEVDVNNASFDTSAISNGNYRLNRVNFHGANVGVWASCNALIEESYGHGLSNSAGGIHEDVIDADTSNNVTVNHSWLSAVGGRAVTGAMVFNATWGVAHHGTVNNSFLQGGNGADARFAENQHNMKITNNAFSNVNGWGGTTFLYGWNQNQPGMVWSGNYVPETGKQLNYSGVQY